MTSKVALFQLRGRCYALLVAAIEQIVLTPTVFRLPLLPSNFAGVSLHKGGLMPVLTSGSVAAAIEPRGAETSAYVIVCSTEYGPLGLPVDRVLRIVEQAAGRVETADDGVEIFCFDGERYPLVKIDTLIELQPCNQG